MSRAPRRRAIVGQRVRGAEDDPRTANQRPEDDRRTQRELRIRTPELEHERLPGRERRDRRREPVGVDEVGTPPARRAARAYESRKSGKSSASQGRLRMFPGIPWPYARPKCRNDAGETTSTSTPAARRCSTASRTNTPATSSGVRGYEVVRTRTRIRRAQAGRVVRRRPAPRPRAPRRRRSSRRSS